MNFMLNTLANDFGNIGNKALDVLSGFGWEDAVEILVLTVIIFFAFRFLKGRKAGALIVGILVCTLVLALSTIFELTVLYKIFDGIASWGMLVILIIFQPEIRDALERIGSGSIHGIMSFSDRKKKKEQNQMVIDNVLSAVKDLSEDSTGALIVIERTTALTDIMQTGIAINADVGHSLIKNLFFNKAPLHDGAVIIAEGRIAAAGCFLPLTRRSDVDPDLGTRHRAAIGMSESSDAVVVVVSEETGAISLAYDCVLNRNLSVEKLKSLLSELLLKY